MKREIHQCCDVTWAEQLFPPTVFNHSFKLLRVLSFSSFGRWRATRNGIEVLSLYNNSLRFFHTLYVVGSFQMFFRLFYECYPSISFCTWTVFPFPMVFGMVLNCSSRNRFQLLIVAVCRLWAIFKIVLLKNYLFDFVHRAPKSRVFLMKRSRVRYMGLSVHFSTKSNHCVRFSPLFPK